MIYELYTLPSCEKCTEVKKLLKELRIAYREISLVDREGMNAFRKVYAESKELIERGTDKIVLFPLLVKRGDSGIEKISQGTERVRELLSA